jgi:uncharacterized membrane protein
MKKRGKKLSSRRISNTPKFAVERGVSIQKKPRSPTMLLMNDIAFLLPSTLVFYLISSLILKFVIKRAMKVASQWHLLGIAIATILSAVLANVLASAMKDSSYLPGSENPLPTMILALVFSFVAAVAIRLLFAKNSSA